MPTQERKACSGSSEARALLDSIDTSTVVGLRDRALIGLMMYSFARIGAALGMAVEASREPRSEGARWL